MTVIPMLANRLLEIFDQGVKKTRGKIYLAQSSRITGEEMAKTFTRVTGKPAVFSPISFNEFGTLSSPLVGPAFKEDAMQMMQWAAEAPSSKVCYGTTNPDDERVNEELGVTASPFEEWLERSGWAGPEEVY